MSSPNTTPLTWNSFVTQLATMAVVQTATVAGIVVGVDDAFNIILPQCIQYSELRIQRDCDILPSLTSNSYSLTPNINTLQLGVNDFVTVQTMGVTVGGALSPLLPVSKEYLQTVYGDPSYLAQPRAFAMIGGDQATGGNTYNNILVGPYPDINYPVVVMGTQRLPTLYQNSGNGTLAQTGTTFISTYLPDLLLMASMIYVSAYQRNFSPMGNDPDMPGSYELQYGNLLKGALVEEARKRFAAGAWSSMGPTPIATPAR